MLLHHKLLLLTIKVKLLSKRFATLIQIKYPLNPKIRFFLLNFCFSLQHLQKFSFVTSQSEYRWDCLFVYH